MKTAARIRRMALLNVLCVLFALGGLPGGRSQGVTNQHHLHIAILGALPPLTDAQEANAAADILRQAGHDVTILTPDQLAEDGTFNAANVDVLVLPHADTFPARAQKNLLDYLRHKGKLLCIGGPAFSHYAYIDGTAWKTRDDLLKSLPDTPLLDVGATDLNAWTRSSNDPRSLATLSRDTGPHGPALHFRFAHFTGWDNFSPPPFARSPFVQGATLTTFWARGGPQTQALVMEWKEKDGSRWIGSVKLADAWQRYALTTADFHYWPDSAAKGRGGPGDTFHPENAREWRIGLAQSHAALLPGPHEFWLAAPGAATLPADLPDVFPPVLEGLSPAYKGFFLGKEAGKEAGAWVPFVRERGLGFYLDSPSGHWGGDSGQGYPGDRWGRLMPATSDAGLEGYRHAWVYLCMAGPLRGALWGGLAFPPQGDPASLAYLKPLVRRLTQRVYLTFAGTNQFSFTPGEPIELGERYTNWGGVEGGVHREFAIYTQGKSTPINDTFHGPTDALQATGDYERHAVFSIPDLLPGEYRFQATLTWLPDPQNPKNAEVIDVLSYPFRVLPRAFEAHSAAERVRVKGGEFVINGKPWRPVGVNYWPLWIGGMDPARYRQGWLMPDQYDPELVERDLATCQQLGINLVSVQYTHPGEGPALDDFLARCRNHHLKVNVFVANANPLDYNLEQLKHLVDAARLRDNDTVFAFDVAWEPRVGVHPDRKRLDPEWRQWITTQYGSAANAEADWGQAAPRENGQVTNPGDDQLAKDGPWRIMVAAYRRFLDDRISQGYGVVARMLRPYGALLGARSGYGGNGSLYVAPQAPFDLLSGAAHLDFISPEGYAFSGDWPEFRGGGLTFAYARWAGAGKPVFLAEFGQSVYPQTDAAKIAAQAATYDKVYRLIADSGANGSAAWWFPGGLRIDENSDYGIIDPDGTPRPAARRLQQHAGELPAIKVDPKPTTWITLDRDADARGYAGVYEKWRGEYGRVRAAGKVPGVRTLGAGATTADMPLVAVGNVPANGHNPLKYANGEIYADESAPGTVVLCNTGEATWTSQGPGHVELIASAAGHPARLALPRAVPRYGTVAIPVAGLAAKLNARPVALRLAVVGRPAGPAHTDLLPFGEQVTVP